MVDDADGASAPRVILTSEKLFMVVATFAQYERFFAGGAGTTWITPSTLAGLVTGIAVMYATALLVKV